MRKVAAFSMAVLVFAGSSAFAGIANFQPSSQDIQVNSGTQAVMTLTLQSQDLANFDSADIVINADVPFSWAYSPTFTGFVPAPTTPTEVGLGVKPFDLYVGGGAAIAGQFGNQIELGTLTFNTAGLAEGTYNVLVSSELDQGITNIARQGVTESVSGSGSFNVVPEPATLGLLALGALGLIRRRVAG